MVGAAIKESLANHLKKVKPPRFQYGHKYVTHVQPCLDIIQKLDLKSRYIDSKKLEILDIFPGYGLFSVLLNSELKPSKHVIVEHSKENVAIWKDRVEYFENVTGNEENYSFVPKNGFKWEVYDELIEGKFITPEFQSRDKVHDELLIIGNLTTLSFGESLLAQWIMCCVYQNWLQKYGRVRMVCFVPELTAQKFLSGPCFTKRNKSAVKRELFTDCRLIALTESQSIDSPSGFNYDPNTIYRDQPVIIPSKSILPVAARLAVIEVIPKNLPLMDVTLLEYIIQIFMFKSTGRVEDAMAQLAPGAEKDLSPLLSKELLKAIPRDLKAEDFLEIFRVFDNWAFKPSAIDTMGISQEDTRYF